MAAAQPVLGGFERFGERKRGGMTLNRYDARALAFCNFVNALSKNTAAWLGV